MAAGAVLGCSLLVQENTPGPQVFVHGIMGQVTGTACARDLGAFISDIGGLGSAQHQVVIVSEQLVFVCVTGGAQERVPGGTCSQETVGCISLRITAAAVLGIIRVPLVNVVAGKTLDCAEGLPVSVLVEEGQVTC